MDKVEIHNRKSKKWHNYWKVKEIVEEAMRYWKEMGFESLREEFKKMVAEL